MQALDNCISPIPGFKEDIPILAIPVSTRSPSEKSAIDPSTGASARASKTRTDKRKVATNLTPQKETKKAAEKSSSGIKINEPVPKASPAPTPPLGSEQKISIHRSKRYSRCVYLSFMINL
jgi:hypothetical protein